VRLGLCDDEGECELEALRSGDVDDAKDPDIAALGDKVRTPERVVVAATERLGLPLLLKLADFEGRVEGEAGAVIETDSKEVMDAVSLSSDVPDGLRLREVVTVRTGLGDGELAPDRLDEGMELGDRVSRTVKEGLGESDGAPEDDVLAQALRDVRCDGEADPLRLGESDATGEEEGDCTADCVLEELGEELWEDQGVDDVDAL
jgi:hypothetical protein